MSLVAPIWPPGLFLVCSILGAPLSAQDDAQAGADPVVDSLVEEVWGGDSALQPSSEGSPGEVLELSLQAARAIGLTNDLRLQSAQAVVEAARHRELGSWAAFDWVFNATGGITEAESDASNIFDAGNDRVDSSTQELSLGFERAFAAGGAFSVNYNHNNTKTNSFFNLLNTANQDVLAAVYTRPLKRGAGGDYATSLQGIAGLRWSREQEAYRMARQAAFVNVDLLYWDLVLAERQLAVAGSALDLALEQLDRDRRRRDAGVATEVEVIQDEATVARRIEGVLLAETNMRSAMDVLRSALFPGVGSETWAVSLKSVTPLPEPGPLAGDTDWQSEIDESLTRRAEVRMAEVDLEIAKLRHDRSINERQPLLDLMVQLSSQGYDATVADAVEETLTYEYPTLSAGLSFQLPMGNVARDREERAARAELRAARIGLEAQRSEVAMGVREALRRVRYQAEATRAASKTRQAAERLMEAERSRYQQGLSTNFQVLEFQQALVEAQYAEHASRAAYGQALATLSGERGVAGESQGGKAP